MDYTQKMQNIQQVIVALNNIDVKGKNNLANLMGSINILEEILTAMSKEQEEHKEKIK